jgi:aldose 1-epimerase
MNETIKSFEITNSQGSTATFLNRGLLLKSLKIKMPDSTLRETVLGWEQPDKYLSIQYLTQEYPYMGAFIGRYANRISRAQFSIGQDTYALAKNFPPHCLHGGKEGFDKKFWSVEQPNPHTLLSTLHSPHMDQGFPGNCHCKVKLQLNEKNCLTMEVEATVDRPCPLNFTYHPYFNLNPEQISILDHTLQLKSSAYLQIDREGIPTSKMEYLPQTLLSGKEILEREGLDISLINNGIGPAAILRSQDRKIGLAISSDAPILHIYTGKNTPEVIKEGKRLGGAYGSICLEPMQYTNAVNNADFPSTLYTPERPYKQSISYQFLLENSFS